MTTSLADTVAAQVSSTADRLRALADVLERHQIPAAGAWLGRPLTSVFLYGDGVAERLRELGAVASHWYGGKDDGRWQRDVELVIDGWSLWHSERGEDVPEAERRGAVAVSP